MGVNVRQGVRGRVSAMASRVRARAGSHFESQLAWIFGSPRSGSTWLLLMLARHPAVVPVNEPLIGWYLGPFLCDLPGFNASALDLDNFTLRRVQRNKRDQFFAQEFSDVWKADFGEMMRKRFYAHASRFSSPVPLDKRMVMIKEPNGSQSADMIMSVLPQARLLFLLRDGRDVVDSELAANKEGSWVSKGFPGVSGISAPQRRDFVTQSAYKWLWRTEVVQQAYRDHPGPKLLVRYEDLLADPTRHVRAIFDWLGLEITDQQLGELIAENAFDQTPPKERGPDGFFRAATPGLWRQNLSADEQTAMTELLAPKLIELGYEV
jgi:hypothetical protein